MADIKLKEGAKYYLDKDIKLQSCKVLGRLKEKSYIDTVNNINK